MSSAYVWRNLPLVRSPLVDDEAVKTHARPGRSDEEAGEKTSAVEEQSSQKYKRWFRHLPHSTNLELFYDLFFVANLTAFTSVHEINDAWSLREYIGFFSILWFTWYQVSLYEVRFGMDSVFERVGKAAQFLVMMVFAVCGPRFSIDGDGEEMPSYGYFRALTIALMISRLVLVAEYLQVAYFARKQQARLTLPILLSAGIYFVAAIVYLGIFWALNASRPLTYIAWFVLAVMETLSLTIITIVWRAMSFKGTHLVERMSLLTLIILGEGAISTARAVQTVATSDGVLSFEGSVSALVVCAVLNLYFMYMIYFDWIHEELFGFLRIQIWATAHYGLHIVLALAVEGAAQCITWNAGVVRSQTLVNMVYDATTPLFHGSEPASPAEFKRFALELNDTATEILRQQLATSTDFYSTSNTFSYWYQKDEAVVPAIINGTKDLDAARNATYYMTGVLYETIFAIAGFNAPVTDAEKESLVYNLNQPINFSNGTDYEAEAFVYVVRAWEVFSLTFVYFFVATGWFVLFCATLAVLNGGSESRVAWVRLLLIRLVGAGIALLACIAATETSLENFVQSPWMLPTITLLLFFIVVLDSIRLPDLRLWRRRDTA